jgi:hypothetical protein
MERVLCMLEIYVALAVGVKIIDVLDCEIAAPGRGRRPGFEGEVLVETAESRLPRAFYPAIFGCFRRLDAPIQGFALGRGAGELVGCRRASPLLEARAGREWLGLGVELLGDGETTGHRLLRRAARFCSCDAAGTGFARFGDRRRRDRPGALSSLVNRGRLAERL